MIRSTFLAAIAVTSTLGVAGAAPVTIDTFQTAQSTAAPNDTTPFENPVSVTGAAPEAIGGQRTVSALRLTPDDNNSITGQQVEAIVTPGLAGVSTGFATTGYGVFLWGGASPLNADLVDGTNEWIDITVLSADQSDISYTLGLDGVQVLKMASAAGTLRFNFSEFGGVDATNISTISLLVNGPESFDTTFSFIGADGPVTSGVVPLPAGGLLALGGMGALGALRTRRSRKA